ncbi:MAG: hypothetical protein JXN64_10255 [Spirochaetes bacterium]|nr:hypothetical protein [Spirochaetota bacterium]
MTYRMYDCQQCGRKDALVPDEDKYVRFHPAGRVRALNSCQPASAPLGERPAPARFTGSCRRLRIGMTFTLYSASLPARYFA